MMLPSEKVDESTVCTQQLRVCFIKALRLPECTLIRTLYMDPVC